jgi:putative transposase
METFIQGVIDHGQPGACYLDNGKDFRMYRFSGGRQRPSRKGEPIVAEKHVAGMLSLLEVDVHFAAPYNAKAKVIEPWFKIVAENFDKRWPTYCGNKPERRPERFKALNNKAREMAEAGYTLEAFSQAFAQWVTGDYGLRPSPAEAAGGLSPERAFMELRAPDFQPARPSLETLCLLLMPSQRVRVEPNGVWVAPFGQHYDSPALEDRRCGSGRDLRRKVTYRWMSQDPSKVYLFDALSDKFVCVATPFIGSAIHPLAPADSDDAKRLAATMALRNGLAKRMNKKVRELRGAANARLLAGAQAAGMLGILDDPTTILPAPAPVIRIAGKTEQLQLAAIAGKAAEARAAATADAEQTADQALLPSCDLTPGDDTGGSEESDAWDLLIEQADQGNTLVGEHDEQPVPGSGPSEAQ